MKKKSVFKQCCCFELEGDNPNCPVHYPKMARFQLFLAVLILCAACLGGIYLAVAGCQ